MPTLAARTTSATGTHDWYLGVGPSAASFLPAGGISKADGVGAVRSANALTDAWLAGEPADSDEPMTGEELARDAVMCGLRTVDGVDLVGVAARAGLGVDDVIDALGAELDRLLAEGLVERRGDRLCATMSGVPVLDRVAGALL